MIRFRPLPTILIAAVIGTGITYGAHISIDSQYGPGTITRDINTGLDWLDLTVTQGLSTSEVELGLGDMPGFRYATQSELSGFTGPYLPPSGPVDIANALAFVALVGSTNNPPSQSTFGLFDPRPLEDSIMAFALYIYPDNTAEVDRQSVGYPRQGFENTGHFLVRTAIPEVSTFWLLCGGLAVLMATRTIRGRVSHVRQLENS